MAPQSRVRRSFVAHSVARRRKHATFVVLVAGSAGKNRTPFTPNLVGMNGVF